MDNPIPEAVVTDALIADLLPAALIFAENEEHLDHARQRAKTILLETLTAAQQQGQAVACKVCGEDEPRTGACGSQSPDALCNRAPQPMQQGGGEVAWDFVDIANRAQIATGRGVMPSTVEAVLRAAGVVQPMQQGGGEVEPADKIERLAMCDFFATKGPAETPWEDLPESVRQYFRCAAEKAENRRAAALWPAGRRKAAPPSAPVGELVSALQSMRDRMMAALPPKFGDAFDGDFDTLLEAINAFKAGRGQNLAALAQQPAAVDEAMAALLEKSAALEKVLPVAREYAHAAEVRAFREALTAALAGQQQEPTP